MIDTVGLTLPARLHVIVVDYSVAQSKDHEDVDLPFLCDSEAVLDTQLRDQRRQARGMYTIFDGVLGYHI